MMSCYSMVFVLHVNRDTVTCTCSVHEKTHVHTQACVLTAFSFKVNTLP